MQSATSRRVVLAAALSGLIAERAQAAAAIGVVGAVKGQAFAKLEGTRALRPPGDVFLGDEVWTEAASAANLQLGRVTTVDLGANARLVIDRFVANAGGRLTLGEGAMLFDRPEELPKIELEVRTNYAMIGVRGTMFFAGPSRGVFGVYVERGQVVVSAAGQSRTVGAGEGTNIAHPGDPPSAVTKWATARVVEAMASVRG
jgi:hypothetical protein